MRYLRNLILVTIASFDLSALAAEETTYVVGLPYFVKEDVCKTEAETLIKKLSEMFKRSFKSTCSADESGRYHMVLTTAAKDAPPLYFSEAYEAVELLRWKRNVPYLDEKGLVAGVFPSGEKFPTREILSFVPNSNAMDETTCDESRVSLLSDKVIPKWSPYQPVWAKCRGNQNTLDGDDYELVSLYVCALEECPDLSQLFHFRSASDIILPIK